MVLLVRTFCDVIQLSPEGAIRHSFVFTLACRCEFQGILLHFELKYLCHFPTIRCICPTKRWVGYQGLMLCVDELCVLLQLPNSNTYLFSLAQLVLIDEIELNYWTKVNSSVVVYCYNNIVIVTVLVLPSLNLINYFFLWLFLIVNIR